MRNGKKRDDKAAQVKARLTKATRHENGTTETERRVNVIVEKFNSGLWVPGITDLELATEWNVSRERVANLAAEASRVMRRAVGPIADDIRMQLVAMVHGVRIRAMARTYVNKKGKLLGSPDFRAELDAIRLISELLGVRQLKVSVSEAKDRFAGWTEQELLDFANTGEVPIRIMKLRDVS